MANAMSEFNRWVSSTSSCVDKLSPQMALQEMSRLVLRDYHARIWFVEIHGPRWSFYAGQLTSVTAAQRLQLIELDSHFGMVCGSLGTLRSSMLDALIAFINKLLNGRINACTAPGDPHSYCGGEMAL